MFYDEYLDGNLDMEEQKLYIMKRSGERVLYDSEKIASAIKRANLEEGILSERLTEDEIYDIVRGIEKDARNANRDLSVEEIQDKVEDGLMSTGKHKVARLYITYRYKHNELRKMSNIDQKISGVVERDNEESIIKNREIHEKINSINNTLDVLGKAREFYREYPDSVPSGYMTEMEEELLKKINDWRGKKIKINKFEEAVPAAGEFERDTKKLVLTYGNKIKTNMDEQLTGLRNDFETEYKNIQYDDFEPETKLLELPEIGIVESFAQKLLEFKEEKYVAAKEDLIGMFFKARQGDEKEMVLETTYYYKNWRDYVSELVKKVADAYEDKLKLIYKGYLTCLRDEYVQHIEMAIEQETLKRSEVESQLSEDEKLLRDDNLWLAKFNEQRVAIERG